VGTSVPLFSTRLLNGPTSPLGFRAQYDVTRDGQRFLLNLPAEDTTAPTLWPGKKMRRGSSRVAELEKSVKAIEAKFTA
jgi:hypothetical protein